MNRRGQNTALRGASGGTDLVRQDVTQGYITPFNLIRI
jgi:hypothetical protein